MPVGSSSLDSFAVLLDILVGFFWLGFLVGHGLFFRRLGRFGEVDVALQRGVVFDRQAGSCDVSDENRGVFQFCTAAGLHTALDAPKNYQVSGDDVRMDNAVGSYGEPLAGQRDVAFQYSIEEEILLTRHFTANANTFTNHRPRTVHHWWYPPIATTLWAARGGRNHRNGADEVFGATLAFKVERESTWRPAGSKLEGASHCSKFARRKGHSESNVENQAVSRLRPLMIMCWRKTPSKTKPRRRAARRE